MRTPPERTPEERQAALDEALQIRRDRARLKAWVKRDSKAVMELLDVGGRGTGDKVAGGLRVGDLLEAVDGIGPVMADKLIAAAAIDDRSRRLDTLTIRDVSMLKDAFRVWLG